MTNHNNRLPLKMAVNCLDIHHAENISDELYFSGATIDSRTVTKGDIFIALKGEKVDGHDFIEHAIAQEAIAIIVDKRVRHIQTKTPIIQVPSSQIAFGQLARLWRIELFKGRLIALTGSNGKTTIKNMLNGVLKTRYKTGSTYANYNNELGIPLTIFSLPLNCDYWVVEMGARHVGDIDYLCQIASPNITFISNIGNAHIGEFGDKEQQLRTKSEILSYGKMSVLDSDSPFYERFLQSCEKTNKLKILTIAKKSSSQKAATHNVTWDFIDNQAYFHTDRGAFNLQLPCLGEHNAHNAAWAVTIARYCGIEVEDIIKGLQAVSPETGRLQSIKCKDYTIINDSYNASPESVEALLELTQSLARKIIMIWGDMAELGNETQMKKWHQNMAIKFNQYHVAKVITYGPYASFTYEYGKSLGSETGAKTQYHHAQDFSEIKQTVQRLVADWKKTAPHNKKTPEDIHICLKASNKMNFTQLAELLSEC